MQRQSTPTTNLGMTQDKSKIVIFCVDGRTDSDRGLDFYEAYRVCKSWDYMM